jgi:ABC-2 type transport system permease protein
MPMALILVITLIQNNILEETKRSKIRVLVINEDQDDLGYAIEKGLNDSDFFEIQKTIQGSLLTEDSLRRAIAGGDFQIGLIIQQGATRAFSNKLKEFIKGNDELALKSKKIILILDPTVQSTLKQSIESALKLFVQGETIRGLLEGVAEFVKPQDAKSEKGQSIAESFKLENKAFIEIQPEYAMMNASQLKPTVVQHSVPAWTIFGIFFIVLPLSGSVIRERQEGTLTRLFAMPVPFVTILLGKIFTYGFRFSGLPFWRWEIVLI